MTDVRQELIALLRRGERGALATLISRRGSAPGALGSQLLVRADGTAVGSIGGGCVEADVWQEAIDRIGGEEPAVLSFRLNGREAAESGLICGGAIEVLVEPVRRARLDCFEALAAAAAAREPGVLVTVLPSSPAAGEKVFLRVTELLGQTTRVTSPDVSAEAACTTIPAASRDAAVRRAAAEGLTTMGNERTSVVELHDGGQTERLLLEFAVPPVTLLVLGAGHLSREVVPLAKRVHFRVAVADDRPLFANTEVLPDADEVLLGEFADIFDRHPVDRNTFVLIVTRGHLHDEMLLEKALLTDAGYVGMIGSRGKIRTIYQRLRERGVTEERLAFVHAPVGVSIGARPPEEIAVSIVAELIAVRNGERT